MKQTERDEINVCLSIVPFYGLYLLQRLQKIARLEALGLPVPPELRAPPAVTQDVLNVWSFLSSGMCFEQIINTPGTKTEHQEGERYEGVGTTTEPQLDVVREVWTF